MTFALNNSVTTPHWQDFVEGLKQLREDALPLALKYFQKAYESAPATDVFHNKYTSYCGLARVLTGDEQGVDLCRRAAQKESIDGDVYLNLAYAEWHMNSRARTISVLQKGLQVDQQHPGLNKLKSRLKLREKTAIEFIPRNSFLNVALGKLARKKEVVSSNWTYQHLL